MVSFYGYSLTSVSPPQKAGRLIDVKIILSQNLKSLFEDEDVQMEWN